MSSLRNKVDCTTQLEKKQRTLLVQQALPKTIKVTTEFLKVAQKQVRKLWKDFQSKRLAVLEDQEEAYIASCPNMCPVRAAHIFKTFKDSSRIYSELLSKRHKSNDLSTIEIPIPMEGETLQYQTITDPPLIETEILRRNKRHFRQAENTRLAGTDVSDKIGFGVTTQISDDILEGTADIEGITDDETSKGLLRMFKTIKPAIKIELTKEKMMDRYKKWNKRTATSPSGRHLGHYHSLFRPFKYDLDNAGEKAEIKEKRELISDVHFMMLQIAAENSHVYEQWKNILTCMIEKDLGSAKIHQLRVIHLYECELNLFWAYICKKLINTVKTIIFSTKGHMEDAQANNQLTQ